MFLFSFQTKNRKQPSYIGNPFRKYCTDSSMSDVEKTLLIDVHRLHHRSMNKPEDAWQHSERTVQDIIDIMSTVKFLRNLSEVSATSSFILVCATKNILSGIKYVDHIEQCRLFSKANRDLIISSVRLLLENYLTKTKGTLAADFKFQRLLKSIENTMECLAYFNTEQSDVANNQLYNEETAANLELTAANLVLPHTLLTDLHEINMNLSINNTNDIYLDILLALLKHIHVTKNNLTRKISISAQNIIVGILCYTRIIADLQDSCDTDKNEDLKYIRQIILILERYSHEQESGLEDNTKLEHYLSFLLPFNPVSSVGTADADASKAVSY